MSATNLPPSQQLPEALLQVQDLAVVYPGRRGTVYAVNGVSFQVRPGETIGIVGETGCGKSTAVRALIGLLAPPGQIVGGRVRFHNRDLLNVKPGELRRVRASGIAFIPQNAFGALDPVVKIEEQFHNVIRLVRSASRTESRELAKAMLEHVGIVDPPRVLNGYVHNLSGGMAQRVVIAMSMIRNPEIVIADEPTTGLDMTVLRQILELLAKMREERGCAMLIVTHHLGVVAQYCSRVIVMYAGQVIEFGSVREVFTSPSHPYTEALLGSVPRRGQPLMVIPGVVPSLREPPSACPFRERCHVRDDERCGAERPPLRLVAPDHWAATYVDLAAIRARQPAPDRVPLVEE